MLMTKYIIQNLTILLSLNELVYKLTHTLLFGVADIAVHGLERMKIIDILYRRI